MIGDSSQPGFTPELAHDELSLPAFPPPEVLDAIGAAADRVDALAAADRELNFRIDDATGRVVVELRDLAGDVIRTVAPSDALAVMAGAGI
jgi:hypothetical protein